MALSKFELRATATFAFRTPVTNWAALAQGDNQVLFNLTNLDVGAWNQAYAGVLALAGGASATVDLRSFTNLAGEPVALTKALAVVIKNAPAVAGAANCALKVTPGSSNGLVWFAGATDGLVLAANESFALAGDPAGTGKVVDATHKTLTFANTGTNASTVTVVILGSTL